MNKHEILSTALQARDSEIFGYQLNIDNYRLAIEHIKASGDPDLGEFQAQLEALLASEILEQKKAKVMHGVISAQLAG